MQENCHEVLLQLAEADMAAMPGVRHCAMRLLGMLPTCPTRLAALQVLPAMRCCSQFTMISPFMDTSVSSAMQGLADA